MKGGLAFRQKNKKERSGALSVFSHKLVLMRLEEEDLCLLIMEGFSIA
ncbi:MAG: hypothetical protein E7C85_06165 [Anaerococcus prevotii]|nr:hypothetical protein [Anaerococcus prevotii]